MRRGNGPRVTLTDAKRGGGGKSEAHFPRRKSIKNPRAWLKMKWYDRIHWISSEFKSEVGCDYATRR